MNDELMTIKDVLNPCMKCGSVKCAVCSKDLETFRQNLIEDIDSIDCTDKSKLSKYQIIEEVLEILDKRFGVKS